ncbi:MAG: hypothetical protein U5K54_06630 [Cytophagales bacterium]|nr:hypothetical protein [Cytophagales bacterium]
MIDAVHTGALEESVYNSYLKLIKEQRRFEINADDKKRMNKQFGKMARQSNNYRRKNKY